MKTITLLTKAVFFGAILGLFNLNFTTDSSAAFNAEVGGAYLTFAEKFGGELTQNDLNSTTTLGVAGCAAGSTITTYKITIKYNGRTISYKNASNKLNNQIISTLKNLKSGDSFNFQNVRAKLPTGGVVDVISREFRVV